VRGDAVRLRWMAILMVLALPLVAAPSAQASGQDALPTLLYAQMDAPGVGEVSQHFEPAFEWANADGADDFTVPAGVTWGVMAVQVTGSYDFGPGPADSETVTFYRDAAGLPGPTIVSFTVNGTDTDGSFKMRLPTHVRLRPGTYWISVVINMSYIPNGEWFWGGQTTQHGYPGAWRSPSDGYGTGCVTWHYLEDCGLHVGPDFAFALYGQAR
jgi:hypothetical protein